MKTICVFFVSLCVSVGAMAAPPLLAPADLQARLAQAQVRVIDIREPGAYAAGHIPGALSAPYARWRGPASNPGALPALSALTELLQGLGLTSNSHAVVVYEGRSAADFGAAARVYWTLKSLGLRELSILNGGLLAWQQAALPLTAHSALPARSQFVPTLDRRWLATREDVQQRLATGGVNLLDARPREFFKGDTRHPAAKLAGTIKGAQLLEHDEWFAPGGASLQVADAPHVLRQVALQPGRETVTFCNTGHWAATNWFALSEVLGQKQVKLYPGSMVDWTQAAAALPMDHVPSRAKQLVMDSRLWANTFFQ